MPHAFRAHPKHPAVEYLVRLHADIGGQIKANKAEAERLVKAMQNIEAVIKLFDPDYSVRAISARRRIQGNPWFKRGAMFRHALDALRKANAPMTVKEIADAVMTANRITGATGKQRRDLDAALRACLEANTDKTVERAGDGIPRRWQITK